MVRSSEAGLRFDQARVTVCLGVEGLGRSRALTLPYLLNRVFRSVALVVEDRPLTHRFLLLLLTAAPPSTAAHGIQQ